MLEVRLESGSKLPHSKAPFGREPTPVRDKALAYLRGHNVLTLATNGPAGLWAAALFYVNEEFRIYFISAPQSRHGVNLKANSAVAAAIQEDYRDWRAIKGIQLEGNVRRVHGVEKAAAMRRYVRKFPVIGAGGPREIKTALQRICWYELIPRRLFFIDNELGLGHREEAPLS
jgi:uncharacterized protein YhbP (UPF0306 family)